MAINFKEVPRRKGWGFEIPACLEGKFIKNGVPETQLLQYKEKQFGLSFLYI